MSKVLILGNGVSRLQQIDFIKQWTEELWVCNWGFKEAFSLPRVDKVCTVHADVIPKALTFKEKHGLSYQVITSNRCALDHDVEIFAVKKGWSTGALALSEALEQRFDEIVLAGFDFGGKDIYQPQLINGSNFINQFKHLQEMYDIKGVSFLSLQGDTFVSLDKFTYPEKDNQKGRFKSISTKKSMPVAEFIKPEESVIIIGNSPVVLEKELGEKIDTFDHVIRINEYIANPKYSEFVGQKTTIWVTGASVSNKLKQRDITDIKSLLLVPKSGHRCMQTLKQKVEKSLELPFYDFELVQLKDVIEIEKLSQMSTASTGFTAVMFFSRILKIPNIFVYGFDFFENKYHYYDQDKKMATGVPISSAHNFEREKSVFNELIDEGSLIQLS